MRKTTENCSLGESGSRTLRSDSSWGMCLSDVMAWRHSSESSRATKSVFLKLRSRSYSRALLLMSSSSAMNAWWRRRLAFTAPSTTSSSISTCGSTHSSCGCVMRMSPASSRKKRCRNWFVLSAHALFCTNTRRASTLSAKHSRLTCSMS